LGGVRRRRRAGDRRPPRSRGRGSLSRRVTAPLVCVRFPVDLLVLVAAMIPSPRERFADWWANGPVRGNRLRRRPLPRRFSGTCGRGEAERTEREFEGAAGAVAARGLAGHADEAPPLPRRPHVPGGVDATPRPGAPRHRPRRDERQPLHQPQPPARLRRPSRRIGRRDSLSRPRRPPPCRPASYCTLMSCASDRLPAWGTSCAPGLTPVLGVCPQPLLPDRLHAPRRQRKARKRGLSLSCAEEDSNLHPVIPDQALNMAGGRPRQRDSPAAPSVSRPRTKRRPADGAVDAGVRADHARHTGADRLDSADRRHRPGSRLPGDRPAPRPGYCICQRGVQARRLRSHLGRR
jgi:hypothetical protein